MSIENKLTYLEGTKTAIKDAIVAKGVAIDDNATFRSYATAISTIETGGGTEINNQTKTVEINQNGQTTVSYDEGYTGLESVVINTNVASSGSGDDPFLVLGYSTPEVVQSDIDYSLDIKNNWDMSLTKINFDSDTNLKYFPFVDTKNITNMSDFFKECTSLVFFPNNLDTSNVSFMGGIFKNTKMTDYDLSGWNLENTFDVASMFYNCQNLKNIKINGNQLSNVVTMSYMFANIGNSSSQGTEEPIEIDFSNWNTSNVTNMSYMFNLNYNVKNLDLSPFDTSKVTNMRQMFCDMRREGLTINLSSFNTSNVTDMQKMFYYNYVTKLDLSHFDTSKVTDMSYMFGYCKNLTEFNISNWNTSNVTNMTEMFEYFPLKDLDLSHFDTSKVTNMAAMFFQAYCENLNLGNWNTSSISSSTLALFSIYCAVRKLIWNNLGHNSKLTTLNFNTCPNLGVNDDTYTDARQALTDTFVTNSFDRATAGYAACKLTFHSNTKALFTEEEIAQITAKGYTIA